MQRVHSTQKNIHLYTGSPQELLLDQAVKTAVHTTPSLADADPKTCLLQRCRTGLRATENPQPARVSKPVVPELQPTSTDDWAL